MASQSLYWGKYPGTAVISGVGGRAASAPPVRTPGPYCSSMAWTKSASSCSERPPMAAYRGAASSAERLPRAVNSQKLPWLPGSTPRARSSFSAA